MYFCYVFKLLICAKKDWNSLWAEDVNSVYILRAQRVFGKNHTVLPCCLVSAVFDKLTAYLKRLNVLCGRCIFQAKLWRWKKGNVVFSNSREGWRDQVDFVRDFSALTSVKRRLSCRLCASEKQCSIKFFNLVVHWHRICICCVVITDRKHLL